MQAGVGHSYMNGREQVSIYVCICGERVGFKCILFCKTYM